MVACGPDDHILILVMHHIASDGWSQGILIKDLTTFYRAIKNGLTAELPELPIQYADYAIWQRQHLTGHFMESRLEWWEKELSELSPLQLPTDYPRPAQQSTRGAVTGLTLSEGLANQLRDLSQKSGTTLFMTLLTAFKVLLYRYSGQEDLCVGTPTANRNQREVESLVGFFINTLALRNDLSGNPNFRDLLAQVKENTLSAF